MKIDSQSEMPPRNISGERRRVLGLLAGSVALLAACGGMPGGQRFSRRDNEDTEFSRFSQRGYDASDNATAYPYHETWQYGSEEVSLNLLIPRATMPSPLVIYLPGLGESAEAGETWRQAWAHAGYAVACVQTASGAALWSSSAARNGDFAKVVSEQFAMEALVARMKLVEFVLQGIARRAKAGEGAYARIDTSRFAIAGFDLGAQTALAFAGEKHPGGDAPPLLPGLRAVLALSPQAVLVRGGFTEYFGDIRLPVLTITGTEDRDPYGIVDSPYTRQAPFRYMPPGDKYMLVIEDGTHRFLAGGNVAFGAGEDPNGETSTDRIDGGRRGPPGGMGRFFGFGGDGSGGIGGRGGMGGSGGRGESESMRGGPPDRNTSKRAGDGLKRQAVIVERISLAFLDVTVKSDPVAREWLERDAVRWSDPLARLEMK